MYRTLLIALFLLFFIAAGYAVVMSPAVDSLPRRVADTTPPATTTTFTCADGTELMATLGDRDARVVVDGTTYKLTEVPRATTTTYTNAAGTVTFTRSGDSARLSVEGENVYGECRIGGVPEPEPEPTEMFTSAPLPGAWRFSLEHPASVTPSQVQETIYEFKLIGPEAATATEITDGLYLSVQAEGVTTTLREYVELQEPAGPVTPAEFHDHPAFRYTTISALGGSTVERLSFRLPGARSPIIDIAYDTYGEETERYAAIIDELLGSLTFAKGTNAGRFDVIDLDLPELGSVVRSPLRVVGEARGSWFLERTFPVSLQSADGTVIASSTATAAKEWTPDALVPFTAELTWNDGLSTATGTATLVLRKATSTAATTTEVLRLPIRLSDSVPQPRGRR